MANTADVKRLLVVSDRTRDFSQIQACIKSSTWFLQYKYEKDNLNDIIGAVSRTLGHGTHTVQSVAFIMHGTESEICICAPGGKVLSLNSVVNDRKVREFFSWLVSEHVDRSHPEARLDFLGCPIALERDGGLIAMEMEALLHLPIGMSKDLFGADIGAASPALEPDDFLIASGPRNVDPSTGMIDDSSTGNIKAGTMKDNKLLVGELYFDVKRLKTLQKEGRKPTTHKQKDMSDYEKLRIVGKGAFGTAILYRKVKENKLVIIKEINMLELSASERTMSLNEIRVLALLDHPNIIRYVDSFEKDGVLQIEMEYADGGTLATYLVHVTRMMEEREILVLFHQIVSAIRHMHEHNILHRDLKTANIFLTKSGIIKVGDFGISKMLTTKQGGAHTVLGTPYYISPEMCEGKQYNEKSDVWALGCILYEMCCLQKTFEGSNLPALVNKIMKGSFAPIKGPYSPLLKQLVRDMLQRDPQFRPSASEVLYRRLPDLFSQFEPEHIDVYAADEEFHRALRDAQKNARNQKQPRSVMYFVKAYDNILSLTPIPLPPRCRVREVAVSRTHVVVLTNELMVFSWGEGKKGQLGHGVIEAWRTKPTCVESLKEKAITRVCAGEGFSAFASDSGIVMTCGEGNQGCLGHGDWNSSAKPKLIQQLLSVNVCAIACGSNHVVVVGEQGDIYAWGVGLGGRLGLGHEDDCCGPQEVPFPDDEKVVNVRCGGDGTMLITEGKNLYACGNNARNKLGLNPSAPVFKLFSSSIQVDKALVPTRVTSLGNIKVHDVSVGLTHSAVLTETGKVITFGRNSDGQLGRGHTRNSPDPGYVKPLAAKVATMVYCGPSYTVVGTLENTLYIWGTRYVTPNSRPNSLRDPPGTADSVKDQLMPRKQAFQETKLTTTNEVSPAGGGESAETRQKLHGGSGSQPHPSIVNRFLNGGSGSRLESSLSGSFPEAAYMGGSSREAQLSASQKDLLLRDQYLEPQEILVLYASPAQVQKGDTLNLASVHCQNQNIFLVVDTTVPIPRVPPPAPPGGSAGSTRSGTSSTAGNAGDDVVDDLGSDDEDGRRSRVSRKLSSVSQKSGKSRNGDDFLNDSFGPMPQWLREELKEPPVERPKVMPPAVAANHPNIISRVASADDVQKYYGQHLPGSPAPNMVDEPRFLPVKRHPDMQDGASGQHARVEIPPELLPSPKRERLHSAPAEIHRRIALVNKELMVEKAERNTARQEELKREIQELKGQLERSHSEEARTAPCVIQ